MNYAVFELFFDSKQEKIVPTGPPAPPCRTAGHGGADFFLMTSFVAAVAAAVAAANEPAAAAATANENELKLIKTGVKDSLRSHRLVFAAEKSRKENKIVETGFMWN